jgi:hypothetical protein
VQKELQQKDNLSIFQFALKMMQTGTQSLIDAWFAVMSIVFGKLPSDSTIPEIEQFVRTAYNQFQPILHRYSAIRLVSISYEVAVCIAVLSSKHFKLDKQLQERISQTCSDREDIVRIVFTEELLAKVCEPLDPHTLEIVWMDKVARMM